MIYTLRPYQATDAATLNRVAVSAFKELTTYYDDGPVILANVAKMSELSQTAELIIATFDKRLVGGVAYVPPGTEKRHFPTELPCICMLVVDPNHRGQGVGRSLTQACIERAKRDNAPKIGLHTSPIMEVALPLYLRMGFVKEADIEAIRGVPYAIYYKTL